MSDSDTRKARAAAEATRFFESIWQQGDYWGFESSTFERQRFARLLSAIDDRRYGRVLEIGCGAGVFTRQVAAIADGIVALDVAPSAIATARSAGPEHIDYRVANVMEYDVRTDGPWDLVVMTETIYYLGWLYSFFDVAWLSREIFKSIKPGGRLLLANTYGEWKDHLVRPWIIRTYHHMFEDVGFTRDREEVFKGEKDNTEISVLISVYEKR